MITKASFLAFSDVVITMASILSVVKFTITKDKGMLWTIAGAGAVTFTAFLAYLTFFRA